MPFSLVNLPKEVKNNYEEEDVMYENLSGHMAEERARGEARKEREIAEALRQQGVAISIIHTVTGLSEKEIERGKN